MKQLLTFSIVAAALVAASPAAAKPGDLIVGDSAASEVLRINPKTGAQSTIAADPDFSTPDGIAFDPRGNIYVADYNAAGGAGAVFRIDRRTHAVSTVASGDPFVQPTYLDYSPDGNLYVGDFQAGTVFKLDPGGGEPDPFATPLGGPFGVEVAHDASLFVTEDNPPENLFRVDRTTGDSNLLTPDGLPDSGGLTLAPDGIVYAADSNQSVSRVNPRTRTQSTLVDASPELAGAYDIAIHPNGKLYVTSGDNGTIFELNRRTGDLSTAASGGLLSYPEGIEVEPPKCKGRVANIVGSQKRDKLKGSKFADVIAGLGGKDKIKGVKGNDRLCGGKGKDKLKGGPGKDKLLGQGGKDKLDGGPGKDRERQ